MDMIQKFIFTTLMLLVFGVSASLESFEWAKSKADINEEGLNANLMNVLLKEQGRIASEAFPNCINNTGKLPSNFVVVLKLNFDGRVVNSWLKGTDAFSTCFQNVMVEKFQFKSGNQEFYTAFDYTNVP